MRIVTGLILALIVILLAVSIAWLAMVEKATPDTWLPAGQVRGSEVTLGTTPYTLNFEQQKELIALLAEATPIKGKPQAQENAPTQIKIYLFEGRPPLTLIPLTTDYTTLLLSHDGKTRSLTPKDPQALKALVDGASRP